MKKDIKLILIFLIILSIPVIGLSCKKRPSNPEEIIDFMKTIKTYEADTRYIIINDRDKIQQNCKQYFDRDEGYRIDIEDKRVQIYKEDKIYVKDLKNSAEYSLEKEFDELYRLTFIGEYINLLYSNEEIKYFCKNIEGKNTMAVELIIPGGNRNINKATMYIDTENSLPYKLIIYDARGNERVQVTYENLQVNGELDKNLFK